MKNEASIDRQLSRKELKDLKVLALFTAVYCKKHHSGPKRGLEGESFAVLDIRKKRYVYCDECREFLAYAIDRRINCPLEPKPSCKHCPVHCYRKGHREKVREIMRYSGKYLIIRGRLDLLCHYLF